MVEDVCGGCFDQRCVLLIMTYLMSPSEEGEEGREGGGEESTSSSPLSSGPDMSPSPPLPSCTQGSGRPDNQPGLTTKGLKIILQKWRVYLHLLLPPGPAPRHPHLAGHPSIYSTLNRLEKIFVN